MQQLIDFGFDATSDFVNVLEFLIIICTDGIQFNNKDDKDSKAEVYSKPCKRATMKLFIKIAINYFRKNLHMRCLKVF